MMWNHRMAKFFLSLNESILFLYDNDVHEIAVLAEDSLVSFLGTVVRWKLSPYGRADWTESITDHFITTIDDDEDNDDDDDDNSS